MRRTAFLTIAMMTLFSFSGLVTGTLNIYASSPPALQAEAAILIDQESGKVLYEKNSDKLMYPASTTKILTALVAVENGDMDETITIGVEALMVRPGSSIAGFTLGDQISFRELIWALMLPSGNDAAYTIAVHLGRQQAGDPELTASNALEVFADMMNQRAQDLGAQETNFTVPDGFHDPNHYTTAQDLAIITRAAMQHPFLREVVGTSRYEPLTWIGRHSRPWGNTNQLIRSATENYYEYATGLKTGYTGQAGFTMVSSGSHNDMNLIAVVLNTNRDGRWDDSISLLDYGFNSFSWQQILHQDEVIKTVNISKQDRKQPDSLEIIAVQGFGDIFPLYEMSRISSTVIIDEVLVDTQQGSTGVSASGNPNLNGLTINAPISKGQIVGQLVLTLDGQEIFRTDLAATEDILAMPWWRKVVLPAGLTLGLGLPGVFLISGRKSKRRNQQRYVITGNRYGY